LPPGQAAVAVAARLHLVDRRPAQPALRAALARAAVVAPGSLAAMRPPRPQAAAGRAAIRAAAHSAARGYLAARAAAQVAGLLAAAELRTAAAGQPEALPVAVVSEGRAAAVRDRRPGRPRGDSTCLLARAGRAGAR